MRNRELASLTTARRRYGAILADPPWLFKAYSGPKVATTAAQPYATMSGKEIAALPVERLAADDCALFLWVTWPTLSTGLEVMRAWGFRYKTCGFCWVKGNTLPLFPDDVRATTVGMGYWTRANSEVCLLGTRGRPKRINRDVRQVIIDRPRQHSRKPDETRARIERLVAGPYLELFARERRRGWDAWGNEVGKLDGLAA